MAGSYTVAHLFRERCKKRIYKKATECKMPLAKMTYTLTVQCLRVWRNASMLLASDKYGAARILERTDRSDDLWLIRVDPGEPPELRESRYRTLGVDTCVVIRPCAKTDQASSCARGGKRVPRSNDSTLFLAKKPEVSEKRSTGWAI